MEMFFLPAKAQVDIELDDYLSRLPTKLGIVTTVQFADAVQDLELEGKELYFSEGKHARKQGQLLGCDAKAATDIEEDVDAFLYIGDGQFHPWHLLAETEKDVYAFNPFTEQFKQLDREFLEVMEKRRRGALAKFYDSTDIGVLITIKPGQHNMYLAKKLKKEFPDKNFYMILQDNIDFIKLEDFNFVECYVNTACPRIGIDDAEKPNKAMVNIWDILGGWF